MKTVLVEKENTEKIVKCLQEENVVAFPTETVFGLGVILHSKVGLEKIYALKKRDKKKAITLMVASKEELSYYAKVGENSQKIVDAFMPGKITLVLEKKETLSNFFTAGLSSIGIRIPDDPFVLKILQEIGPLWVTSANITGGKNVTKDTEVYRQFNGKIPMIVKGETTSMVASTVVDMCKDKLYILRSGEITKEMLEEVIT